MMEQESVRRPESQDNASDAVHPLIAEIFRNQAVGTRDERIPLHSHVSMQDGMFLQEVIGATRATRSLEIGMAYGISTLFMCDALQRISPGARHVVIDPFQRTDW